MKFSSASASLTVVPRGVDSIRFSGDRRSESLRQAWGADKSTLVVIGVGRLASEKNLVLLGAAFEAMRPVEQNSRLVLVGDGPEHSNTTATLSKKWIAD